MPTVTQKNIVPGVALAAAVAICYTAPGLTRARITNATLTNTTAGVVAGTVYIVTGSGAPTAAAAKISARSIAPGETYTCPELVNRILEPGDTIQALGLLLSLDVSAFLQT